jgi:hypothetical protein
MGAANGRRAFLFFAAKESLHGDEAYVVASTFHRARVILQLPPKHPVRIREGDGTARSDFPPDVGSCLRVAVGVATSLGKTVSVIDISRPGNRRELVERHVHAETLLPLMVSPSGRRLEGLECFVPRHLRAFLSYD